MKFIFAASAIFSTTLPAIAADWPQADVDAAIQVVTTREKESGIEECVTSSGTTVAYIATQRDIDADGVNEVLVSSSPAKLGNGVSGCYGMTGQNVFLLSKTGRNWTMLIAADNTQELIFHPRETGGLPDVEMTGPGFCFPIHRYDRGEYRSWKVCDGNQQLFADAAPWIKDKSSVAPRDGETAQVKTASFEAGNAVDMRSLFDHNGSDVRIDPGAGTIVYEKPKTKIAGTVKAGMLLFKASAPWDPYDDSATIKGTAYVFKKGCEPAPYEVAGRQEGWHTLVLKGAAPVRAKNGCAVVGYKMNGNATLKFVSWGD